MTALVFVYDLPILGFARGDIVTDDPAIVATNIRARLYSSAWLQGLETGNYSHYTVPYGSSSQPESSTGPIYADSQAQAIISLASQAGITPPVLYGLIGDALTVDGYPVSSGNSLAIYTQAQLDAAVSAGTAPLLAEITLLEALLAGSTPVTPVANDNTSSLSLGLAASSFLF